MNPYSTSAKVKYGLKLMLSLMWATPWILMAVVCAVTFIGIPLAVVFWAVGSFPYERTVRKRAEARYRYAKQGRALEEEGEVPWEM